MKQILVLLLGLVLIAASLFWFIYEAIHQTELKEQPQGTISHVYKAKTQIPLAPEQKDSIHPDSSLDPLLNPSLVKFNSVSGKSGITSTKSTAGSTIPANATSRKQFGKTISTFFEAFSKKYPELFAQLNALMDEARMIKFKDRIPMVQSFLEDNPQVIQLIEHHVYKTLSDTFFSRTLPAEMFLLPEGKAVLVLWIYETSWIQSMAKSKAWDRAKELREEIRNYREAYKLRLVVELWYRFIDRLKRFHPDQYRTASKLHGLLFEKGEISLEKQVEEIKKYIKENLQIRDLYFYERYHKEEIELFKTWLKSQNMDALLWDLKARKEQWKFLEEAEKLDNLKQWIIDHQEEINHYGKDLPDLLTKDEFVKVFPFY